MQARIFCESQTFNQGRSRTHLIQNGRQAPAAIQMKIEDEQLQEWRITISKLREKEKAKLETKAKATQKSKKSANAKSSSRVSEKDKMNPANRQNK